MRSSPFPTNSFLNEGGLLQLNRYMAATFLRGGDDETCYTLEVDAAMLRKALADFHGCAHCRNIMQEPFARALKWLDAKEDNEHGLFTEREALVQREAEGSRK